MTDIAISYASVTREAALEVVETLRSSGLDVWIDDAGREDAELVDIGVPAGQRHWDVIAAALDRAATVLVLDSRAWRQSEYCWREYGHARDAGKRIAVIPIEDSLPSEDAPAPTWPLATVNEVVDAGPDPLVDAHTRLLIAHRAGGSVGWTRAGVAKLAKDVEVLATGDVAAAGIAVQPEISALSERVLRASRRRKRVLRGTGLALLAVLAVITGLALVARSTATSDRARAGEESAFQQSLQLAFASRAALATIDRVSLAEAALNAAPTEEAEAAVAEAAALAEGRQRFVAGVVGTAMAVAVSDDASLVALVTIGQQQRSRALTVFDVNRGTSIGSWDLPTTVLPYVAISPDGSLAAVAALTDYSLTTIDLATREVKVIPTSQQVVSLGFTPEGHLWWADSFGSVTVIVDGLPLEAASLLTATRAAALDPDSGHLYLLDRSGALHTLEPVGDGTFTERTTPVPAFDSPPPPEEDGGDSSRYDWLLVCDGRITAVRPDAWAVVDGGVVVDSNTFVGRYFTTTTFACFQDHVVRISLGFVGTFPEDLDYPTDLVLTRKRTAFPFGSNSTGSHLVTVQPDGTIDVISAEGAATEREFADSIALVTFDDRVVLIAPDGTMSSAPVSLGGELTPFGEVGSGLTTSLATRVADSWFVGTERGLAELRSDGTVVSHDPEQDGRLRRTFGESAVLAGGTSIVELTLGETAEPTNSVEVEGILPNESLFEAHGLTNEKAYVATTSFGRLLLVDAESGSVISERQVAPAGPTPVVATNDGLILVVGADGVLQQFDSELAPIQSTILGPATLFTELSPDGTLLLVQSMKNEVQVVDARSLATVFELGPQLGRRYQFSGDGRSLVSLEVNQTDDGWTGTVSSTPLPPLG